MTGKHGDSRSGTEVPRKNSLNALRKDSEYHTTQEIKGKDKLREDIVLYLRDTCLTNRTRIEQLSPVSGDEAIREPEAGIALCLSGGGYRAMLFHLGSLWRLNELGFLPKLDRISSVSGGSITAGVLGLALAAHGFRCERCCGAHSRKEVVGPDSRTWRARQSMRPLCSAACSSRATVSRKVQAAYRKHLFGDATLQDLPDRPRFVINATNVQSKVLWRFSKPYMRDYRVGEVPQSDRAARSGRGRVFRVPAFSFTCRTRT